MYMSNQELRQLFHLRPLAPTNLTHKQIVCRQYKRVLVNCRNHAEYVKEKYFVMVGEARYHYENNRQLTDEDAIEYSIQQGEAWLQKYQHWAPYTLPHCENGTAWQRNMEVPQQWRRDDAYVDWEAEIRLDLTSEDSNPIHRSTTWKNQFTNRATE